MSCRIVVPLAEGFEEIETVTIVDVLRRAELDVTLAGLGGTGPIRGSRGIHVAPDVSWTDVRPDDFDVIVLPGGMGGTLNLIADLSVLAALKSLRDGGRLTAAICAAPLVLDAAGVVDGRPLTAHPSVHERLEAHDLRPDQRVVVSGDLITSQGPGTSLEFALALVERLSGAPKARELADAMVVAAPPTGAPR